MVTAKVHENMKLQVNFDAIQIGSFFLSTGVMPDEFYQGA